MCRGGAGGGLHFLEAGVRLAPTDVLGDAAREENRALRHEGYAGAELLRVSPANVEAVHQHPPLARVVEARDEGDEARLSRARRADDTEARSRPAGEAHAPEGRLLGPVVAEPDLLEGDAAPLPPPLPRGAFRGSGRRPEADPRRRIRFRPYAGIRRSEYLAETLDRSLGPDEHVEDE